MFSGYKEFQNQEYAKALPKLLRAAKQGNSEAQCMLGNLYQMGLGVEENLDEAAVWYTRSSNQGYGLASNNLAGILQQRGHIDAAKHYYQLAQKQGFQHSPAA